MVSAKKALQNIDLHLVLVPNLALPVQVLKALMTKLIMRVHLLLPFIFYQNSRPT
jgi:hypothetical protein